MNCVSHLSPWLNDRNMLLCMTYVHVLVAECLSVRLLFLQCKLLLVGMVWLGHKHLSCLGL